MVEGGNTRSNGVEERDDDDEKEMLGELDRETPDKSEEAIADTITEPQVCMNVYAM